MKWLWLSRIGIAAQARLFTWLALLCCLISLIGGAFMISVYEDFRSSFTRQALPLLEVSSATNIELIEVQQSLLDLITRAQQHQIDEEGMYRQGRSLIDRAEVLLEKLQSPPIHDEHQMRRFGEFQQHLQNYRHHLMSAVEMVSVNLTLADTYARRAALEALAVNDASARLQQQINTDLAHDMGALRHTLIDVAVPLGVLLAVVTGLTLLLLRLWAGRLVGSFDAVHAALQQLRTGDTTTPVPVVGNHREALDIALSLDTFRQTLLALAELRADLEARVRERTAQLSHANQELQAQIRRLAEAQRELRLFKRVFDCAAESIMITDLNGHILDVNPACSDITGHGRDELLGRHPQMLRSQNHEAEFYRALRDDIVTKGRWSGEIWARRRNGEACPLRLSITTVHDEQQQPQHYVGIFTDITEIKRTEQLLERMAFHDRLTGLPNRRLLLDRLEHAIALSQRSTQFGAVFFLDLDRFKRVNDTLGHQFGDELLVQVAARLSACMRDADTVGRLAGDEFLVIAERLGSEVAQATGSARRIAGKIIAALTTPFVLSGGQTLQTSTSVGVALFDATDSRRAEALITRADAAMYEAKRGGRGTMHFFDPAMQEAAQVRLLMEQRLRQAVQQGEFRLWLQPLHDRERRMVAAEALIRWHEPGAEPVPPHQFIALAEDMHLIQDIGRHVLDDACRLLREWDADPLLAGLPLAVNISSRQFAVRGFVDDVLDLVVRNDVAPHRLVLELGESAVLNDLQEAAAKMRRLQAAGFRLSLDDFGAGAASLSVLRELPFDQIKIDRRLIASMLQSPSDGCIVESVLRLGTLLQIEVVAAGVETPQQLQALSALGCTRFQGFLLARPMPAAELVERARAAPALA